MSELSENKQRLLEQRLGRRASAKPKGPAPIPDRPAGPAPLSSGQSALLYEHRLRPEQALYNVVFAYRVDGVLDTARFSASVKTVVARHETLRTTFGAQRHELTVEESVEIVRLKTDEAGFDSLSKAEALRRFDLESGPLLRLTVAELGPQQHGVVLAVHHVSSDAASLSNLWREVDLAYHGEELPELTTTFSSHAEWQRERISTADRDFWRSHVGSEAPAADLALERPAPSESDGYLTFPIDLAPSELQAAGARPTPFFLGVYAALVQRYTDTDDVVVGVTASTRDHPHIQDLIGYFLTLLPLQLSIDPTATSTATTRMVDEALASALTHRHVPYGLIAADRREIGAKEVDPARIMFVYDEPHQTTLRGLDVSGRIVHPEVSVTDLTLFVRPTTEGFEVSIEWSGERYRTIDMAGLGTEFARMAEWAARHPGSPWTALPHEADLDGGPLSRELRPLPELIEAHVRANPAAIAVRCGDAHLTYSELWARASFIAGGLEHHGVVRGDRVAVVLPRGTDAVASVLAIQRIGAAHVPIDPTYPAERIALILGQADARIVVVDELSGNLATFPSVAVKQLVGHGTPTAATALGLDDLAYVIFTSGSTGKPKGVSVDHRRLAASTLARLDAYRDSVDTFVMPSSFGFDSSAAGLYWTLVSGGQLVIPTEEEVHDVDTLGQLIADVEATHTLMVPTLYRALLQRDPSALASLRCAIVAGEACPTSLVDLHHRHLPRTDLFNEYGPTETTVWATVHPCRPGQTPVPIGKPIPGATARVVDRWLRPRPSGGIGQLALGGNGVTDGYLDEPELSAERFVVEPLRRARFYLSGDLARIEDDTLIFLGRADHQISVGGLRIEPEEVEAAAMACAGVTAALVRVERQLNGDPFDAMQLLDPAAASEIMRMAGASDDPANELLSQLAKANGTDVLVGYLEGSDLDPATIELELHRRLPKGLVPTLIETTTALPRTEHGKVDRNALPATVRRRRVENVVTLGSGLIANLTAAFQTTLGRPDIGPDTDFFDAGGDSLRAVELVTLLEDRMDRRVPISALVLGRSPRELAALIGTPSVEAASGIEVRSSHVVPLQAGADEPPLLIMPPGGGNLIAFDPLVQALDDRLPVFGFDLPGADRDEELPVSIEDLCDTYMPQLRALAPTGPYRLLGWSFGGMMALELAQRLSAEGEEVELVAMIDTLVPGFQRSQRHKIYLEFARAGDLKAIATRVVRRLRTRFASRATTQRHQAAADGGPSMTPAERERWLAKKIDEIVECHQTSPYAGPVVFFAARDTFTWRTTEPWQELLSDFDIVPLDGSHDGADGLLSGERVNRIAAELSQRLA